MHAARLGRVGFIGELLTRGADPREMNADGNGALWFACFADSAPCVNALIMAGAPLDSQNVNGATALIYAASAGKTEIVKLLLEAGADTTMETLDGFTALELAANRACMKMLRDKHRAIAGGMIEGPPGGIELARRRPRPAATRHGAAPARGRRRTLALLAASRSTAATWLRRIAVRHRSQVHGSRMPVRRRLDMAALGMRERPARQLSPDWRDWTSTCTARKPASPC